SMATPTGGITPQHAEISSGTAAAIRRAHPVRVATLFGFAALGVLTLAYSLVHMLGLPDWAFAGAVGLAAAGLPIILWTGVIERRRAIAGSTGRAAVPAGVQRWFTWRRALLGGAAGFGLLGIGTAVYMAMRLFGIGPVGTLVASGVLAQRDRLVLAVRGNAQDDGAIIGAVDRLSHRLRERIGESLKSIRASDPLEQVTTRSLEALRKYSQGVRASDAAQMARAVTLLQEAIALDTTFAMAYRKLAVVLSNAGGAQSRIAAAATQAFRHRDRLTPFERDLAEAYYYTSVEYDPAKTEAAYRAALEQQPENGVALNNLALLFNERRRFAEAEALTMLGLT